jgi:general secretion pathway protein C
VPLPKPAGSIRDITLLGIYNAQDLTVVTVRYKGKSKVLGKGEAINGFVLERAGNTYAIFTKEGREYRVTLHQSESQNSITGPSMSGHLPKSGREAAKPPAGEIVDAGDRRIVDRSLLEHYTTHIDDIYKNIGLKELKRGNRIEGFRVTFVKRGGPFSKLGLKRGDVIKAVNGEALTSYKRAFDIYKHIGETESVTLVIKRGNKEMELEYEVN